MVQLCLAFPDRYKLRREVFNVMNARAEEGTTWRSRLPKVEVETILL